MVATMVATDTEFLQIYQIVRKLQDENGRFAGKRLTTSAVYDSIKNSNSSLKRRSKKLLEDCIDRVLRVIKEEEQELDDDESLDGEFEGIEENPAPRIRDHNIMNKSITRMWSKTGSANMTSSSSLAGRFLECNDTRCAQWTD
jgi:ribosome biogenesis ATPase